MNKYFKYQIIDMVCRETHMNRASVERITNSFLDCISQAIARGDKVQLTGFGTFEPKKRAARIGRNPHTKEAVPIPTRVVPVFTPGNELKEAVSKSKTKK